jgi:hypothetical protein
MNRFSTSETYQFLTVLKKMSDKQCLKILLIDGSFDLKKANDIETEQYQAVISLAWLSNITKTAMEELIGGTCFTLSDVVGSEKRWVHEACRQTEKIIAEGACQVGYPIRNYIAEDIYNVCMEHCLAEKALDFVDDLISDLQADTVEIHTVLQRELESDIYDVYNCHQIRTKSKICHHPYQEKIGLKHLSRMPFRKRFVRHLNGALIVKNWKSLAWDVVNKFDGRYAFRQKLWKTRTTKRDGGKRVIFFSSYLNNSKALSNLQPYMPFPVHWVLNTYSAKMGVKTSSDEVNWLWAFGFGNGNIEFKRDKLLQEDEDNDDNDKQWLSEKPLWRTWNDILLPGFMRLNQSVKSCLNELKPKLVAVANQGSGIEGLFTYHAKDRGIPTLQILHGILSDHWINYCPIQTDFLIVPGEFWRHLWPEKEQKKIIVFNPLGHFTRIKRENTTGKKIITFFSWPLHYTYNYSEFINGFIRLLYNMIHDLGIHVIVRFHPLENPIDFKKGWERIYGKMSVNLQFSKYEPLNEVLAQTDVALMYRSTVMLNCMINNIPVIMPGWVDFSWKQALDNVPNVFVAENFDEIEHCLREWIKSRPETNREITDYFIQPAGSNEMDFRKVITRLTG